MSFLEMGSENLVMNLLMLKMIPVMISAALVKALSAY